MANNKLHIIITGEEGEGRSLALQKNTMRNSFIALVILTIALGFGTVRGIHYYQQSKQLQAQTAQLQAELQVSNTSLNSQLQFTREQLQRQLAEAKAELARVINEKENLARSYQHQLASLKQDQEALLEGSISKLDERAAIIKTVINQLGVKIKIEDDPDHSGGPFIALDGSCDKLICDTDRYLTAFNKIPLGRPINTKISSPFGRRADPLNRKRAFHSGIDFKGNTGDKIRSTGDAVVKKASYDRGYGYNIVLSHGNGYETMYAHLSKRLVKRGDRVKRGQIIGLVGNSGRSTGSHLHYEVRHYGKAVNPMKFMNISGMTVLASK
jgi:murein DD-endopeptidase MepM/ murein hydrolase activator NlpD